MPAYQEIKELIQERESQGIKVFPTRKFRFRAFKLTPFDKVKVVILGQDPYHTPGMANGLAFSVWPHVTRFPPSLQNIFCEYRDDLGLEYPRYGDLEPWARQGVLLLNTYLTVEQGKPLSHKGIGWEKLTVEVLATLSTAAHCSLVFLLWGANARQYRALIDETKHKVIASSHPSPFSYLYGFKGHRPFSQANEYLIANGIEPINWKLR